ncbi:MAG TPA: flagellar hook-associated protein FlgL [Fimbriimonadaceae bacterium]|jgi:flagellar hook-associated protein 3 FlgL
MRVSTNYEYQLYTADIDNTTSAYTQAQQVVSTGKQINQASDNPGGTMSALTMTALQSQISQFNSNLSTAKDYLSNNEASMTSITNLLNQAYQIGVQGANSTTSSAALNNLASQISDIQSSLVNVGNTQNSTGQCIFAGQQTDTQPFSAANGTLTYSGDSNNISVEVSPGQKMTVNQPGNPLFTDIYNQLESLKTDLQSGSFSKISNTDIANIKSSIANVSDLNGQFGAQIDTVTNLTTANTARSTNLTASISNVVDADMATAIVNMTQAQNAYQAALESTAQASKYSLVDFLS